MELKTLTAKTKKAKNRLAEITLASPDWRKLWRVTKRQDKVPFSDRAGPWIFVEPDLQQAGSGSDASVAAVAERHSRWVHERDDFDFVVA